jgi:hypothetical protein
MILVFFKKFQKSIGQNLPLASLYRINRLTLRYATYISATGNIGLTWSQYVAALTLPAGPGRDPPAAADKWTRTLAPFPPPDAGNGSALRAAAAVADSRLLGRRQSGYGGGRSRAVPARPSAERSH